MNKLEIRFKKINDPKIYLWEVENNTPLDEEVAKSICHNLSNHSEVEHVTLCDGFIKLGEYFKI